MFVISLNYKKASAGVREKWAIPAAMSEQLLDRLRAGGITEAVYLSTCNRCELYGQGSYQKAVGILESLVGEGTSLRENAMVFEGEKAIRYLFRVTSGIESMVIGEDEILGQVRQAYETARQMGYTGYYLNTIFQAALMASKKIKTQTKLSKSSVSVATLAAKLCHYFKEGTKNVLVIGATGDTGTKVIKNLLSYGDCRIYGAVRSSHQLRNEIELVEYDRRYEYMDAADIVVSATKSPHYTVTASRLRNAVTEDKERLFVDLAVPRDIDENLASVSGVTLVSIDEIEELAEKNNELKAGEVENAREILDEEAEVLIKNLCVHEFMELHGNISEYLGAAGEKFFYRMKKVASSDEFKAFLAVIEKMGKTDESDSLDWCEAGNYEKNCDSYKGKQACPCPGRNGEECGSCSGRWGSRDKDS